MADHGARDHAQWSASATERNWNCSGALALTDGLPDKTSEAADWGTCAHQIAEKCLRSEADPHNFVGTVEKGKSHEFEVDEEMADTAAEYVNYVRQAREEAGKDGLLFIEQKFSLAGLKPPFEAGGTGDAVIYSPDIKRLEVVDLKGGRGHVVEVEGNPQLRTYALGAMLANANLAVDVIKVTIVQPRAPHKSGRTRSETFHVADLLEWTVDLVQAMKRSAQAMADYGNFAPKTAPRDVLKLYHSSPEVLSDAEWNREYLNAGDHCKFCKAAGFCPKLEQEALDKAGVWFDDLDQPRISNSPDTLSPERAAQLLDAADMIGEWINAVRAYWHTQAEMGVEIPNYVLVDKVGRRKWSVADERVVDVMKSLGVDDPFTRKVMSPAQAEKALGSKRKTAVAEFVETPINGTNLVRADKTTRKAATPSVHKHFSILD